MKTTSAYKKRSLPVQNMLAFSIIAVALAACGGGGDGSGNTSTSAGSTTATPQQDAVSQASTALVAQTGATVVPGTTSTAQAFDLTADIGDTWRLVLNQDGSFTIEVLSTQYGLTDISGTYTQSTSGSFTTYTGTSANGSFTLKLDTRTRIMGGNVVLRTRSASVAGSGYSVPSDTTRLAGDYFYIGATRNAGDGRSPSFVGGTFRVATNGTDVTLCDSGLINAAGTCDAVAGSSTPSQVALKLVKNTTDGLTHVQQGGSDFGILSFQAGDRGPVLVIDRFGYNQATTPALRTGVIYASKQQVLSGNELNGSWTCTDRGTTIGTVTINGTAVKTADTSGASTAETLYFNDISANTGLVAVNGAATSVVNGQAPSSGVILLPLSSSMFVVERDAAQSVAACR
ncbi:hypothetical protein [Burkholderia pseudomultivorans]|uniref:Lipoprotein n=1 Tax=Burkholderia pseudomultivorans TaxID=1207504 RepID=A0A132EJH7_9BURK|nr:hypothetical protein [Burkholderia pseudomultivorans]KWF33055.1 hypothetical protein WT56_11035 [Burkholderia pseudomultivorans]